MSRILLVDDDPDLHRLIAPALASDGHTVLSAMSGTEGLQTLAREPVDLVIIDYVMPVMDGVQFLGELRRVHPDLRCIMVTGNDTPEAVLGALRCRCSDFLVKPLSIAELRSSISAVSTSPPM